MAGADETPNDRAGYIVRTRYDLRTSNVKEWRIAKKAEIKALKNENKQLKAEIGQLQSEINKAINEELQEIKNIEEKKEEKKHRIYPEIDYLQEKVGNLLPKLDPSNPDHQEFAREVEEIGGKLSGMKSELETMDFKLEIVGDLGNMIKGRLGKSW
jgi:chromosome segregation ATPase